MQPTRLSLWGRWSVQCRRRLDAEYRLEQVNASNEFFFPLQLIYRNKREQQGCSAASSRARIWRGRSGTMRRSAARVGVRQSLGHGSRLLLLIDTQGKDMRQRERLYDAEV
jgi:hypothetical protein